MNNNWVLSILVNKGVLKEEEAEFLSKELGQMTYDSIFKDAHKTITKLLKKYEDK